MMTLNNKKIYSKRQHIFFLSTKIYQSEIVTQFNALEAYSGLDVTIVKYSISRMVSSGMLCRVALERTNVSEELSASFIRVTRLGELRATLAVTSNRHTLPHGVTSQKKPFFIVTTVKTSNLTQYQ
jgi:hypothetical protein